MSDNLRGIINESVFLRNKVYQSMDGSWDRLWSALDSMEDSNMAINEFQKLEKVSYLQLYGLLQALVLQHDAIDYVRQTVLEKKAIQWHKDNSNIDNIRKIRIAIAGHPASIEKFKPKKGKMYSNLDRHSITKSGFTYLIWDENGAHSHNVNLTEILKTHTAEMNNLSKLTIDEIRNNDLKFIKKFKGEKLTDLYEQVSGYQFEKLYNIKLDKDFADTMFESIKRVYLELKNKLEERYGSFSNTINAPGLKLTIDELDELIIRIDKKLDDDLEDEFDLMVYVSALESSWGDLGDMIKETDEVFS